MISQLSVFWGLHVLVASCTVRGSRLHESIIEMCNIDTDKVIVVDQSKRGHHGTLRVQEVVT